MIVDGQTKYLYRVDKRVVVALLLAFFSILLLSHGADAQCIPGSDPLGCLKDAKNAAGQTDRPLTDIMIDIINAALSLIFFIVLGFLIYGGYFWMVSGGNEEKIQKARQILTASIVGLIITLSSLSIVIFISDAIGVAPPTTTGTGLSALSIDEILTNIINAALAFVFFIALAAIIWGGYRWMTAGGNEDTVSEAKRIVVAAVVGMIIVFISFSVITFVHSVVG